MIADLLKDKSLQEQADIKATEIAKIDLTGDFTDSEYGLTVRVISFSKIPSGIELYAQAWKDGKQVGFGDGTVDIERFIFINPPVLVPDGTRRDAVHTLADGNTVPVRVDNFKEDVLKAIQSTLAHTIHMVSKDGSQIFSGKIGKSTLTITGCTVDGKVGGAGTTTWTALRAAAGSGSSSGPTTFDFATMTTNGSQSWVGLQRGFVLFDTSALTSAVTISGATLSIFGAAKQDAMAITPTVAVVSSNPASNTALVNADYSTLGTTEFSITPVTFAGFSTSGYNNIALNASGIANISKTGVSKFGLTNNFDLSNTNPGNFTSLQDFFIIDATANGSNEPVLVVTYSLPAKGNFFFAAAR